MEIVAFALGLALLVTVTLDFLFTTIGADTYTLLSLRIARAIFGFFRLCVRRARVGWFHRVSGPLTMTGLAAFWIFGVSVGWGLIFWSSENAVQAAEGWNGVGWWDVYAHVGHLLSTLGAGKTAAGDTLWYVVGVFVAVEGMVILTLSVSFILTSTQTVNAGRGFTILLNAVDARDPASFALLAPPLASLVSSLNASPFALFYSTLDPMRALPTRIVTFAETAAQGPDFGRYRDLLADLPGFAGIGETGSRHLDDAAFLVRLRAWAAPFQLHPPEVVRARRADAPGPTPRRS